MQVNASIPLSARGVPPIESPAEVYGRAMKLKNLGQNQAAGAEHLRSMRMENQMRERAMDEEAAYQEEVRKAYSSQRGEYQKYGIEVPETNPQPQSAQPEPGAGATLKTMATGTQPTPGAQAASAQTRSAGSGGFLPGGRGQQQSYIPGFDYSPVIGGLLARGYARKAQQLAQQHLEFTTKLIDNAKKQNELAKDTTGQIASLAGTVKDDQTLVYATTEAARRGWISPQDAKTLQGRGWSDPAVQSQIGQWRDMAIQANDQVQNNLRNLEYHARKTKAEHDIAMDQPKKLADWLTKGGQLFMPGMSEEQFDTSMKTLETWKAPAQVLEHFRAAGPRTAYQLGMTSAERAADTRAREAHEDTVAHQMELEGLAAERNQILRDRAANKPESAAERTERVRRLANAAMRDSRAGGGPTYDDAIRNVRKFYPDDAEMNEYREDVIAQLERYKMAGVNVEQAEARLEKSKGSELSQQIRARLKGGAPQVQNPPAVPQAKPVAPAVSRSAAPPKPAAAAPSKPSQAVAKIFPRARLEAFAAANQMNPAEAEAALKAQGYTVQ